jgi:hypothetical protein
LITCGVTGSLLSPEDPVFVGVSAIASTAVMPEVTFAKMT